MSLNVDSYQCCAAVHTVEVVEPLKVRSHGPIRDADRLRDLLVSTAIRNQIDNRDLRRGEPMDSVYGPTLIAHEAKLVYRTTTPATRECRWFRSAAKTLG
jgi:hypothetical protein